MTSMEFMDRKCLSDEAIYTIENMVKNHISGNYQDVRNVILGYDSKNNIWQSKYGEYIARRHVSDIKPPKTSPMYILRNQIDDNNEKIETFSKNNGMTFYDDEVYDSVRIYMDDSVRRVLEALFTVSKNVIEYKHVIDIIVTEWDANNVKDAMSLSRSYTDPGICGDLHYHKIEVRKGPWDDLKKITRHRKLAIRDAFKDAVITFLESRADMIKENDHQENDRRDDTNT